MQNSNRWPLLCTIKIIVILLIFGFNGTNSVSAQHIPNKLNIYASLLNGTSSDASNFNSNGFITPSLFSNFNQNIGFQLSGSYHIKSWIAPVFHISWIHAGKWTHNESNIYENASEIQTFIAPGIRIYTPKALLGFFNSVAFYTEIAAGAGQSNLSLENPIMRIENGENVDFPLNESNLYTGLQARIGATIDIDHTIGLHVNYTLARNQINASLFNDTRFSRSYLEIGINIKLLKSKNYYK